MDSLGRSVERASGHRTLWERVFRIRHTPDANGNGKLHRGHADVDLRPQSEDVWRVLRDI
jgi:hypothetical protein